MWWADEMWVCYSWNKHGKKLGCLWAQPGGQHVQPYWHMYVTLLAVRVLNTQESRQQWFCRGQNLPDLVHTPSSGGEGVCMLRFLRWRKHVSKQAAYCMSFDSSDQDNHDYTILEFLTLFVHKLLAKAYIYTFLDLIWPNPIWSPTSDTERRSHISA